MSRNLILGIVGAIIILIGVITGVFLIRRQQDIRERAAIPAGEVTARLTPETRSLDVGESFTLSIYFNPQAVPISGVAIRLSYQGTGLTASNVTANSALLATGDWTCPIRQVNPTGGGFDIDVSCINTSTEGFSSATDTLLATVDFTADSVPTINPVQVAFDTTQSIITKKADGQDTLLIPTSTGTYTVAAVATATPTASPTASATATADPTATPEGATASPLITLPTDTPTGGLVSPTPTDNGSLALGPTASPTLAPTSGGSTATLPPDVPVSGVGSPVLIGMAAGAFLLLLSFFLVLV